jgi:hypothetical protein
MSDTNHGQTSMTQDLQSVLALGSPLMGSLTGLLHVASTTTTTTTTIHEPSPLAQSFLGHPNVLSNQDDDDEHGV